MRHNKRREVPIATQRIGANLHGYSITSSASFNDLRLQGFRAGGAGSCNFVFAIPRIEKHDSAGSNAAQRILKALETESRPHAGTYIEASTIKRPTIKQTKPLVTSEAHGQPSA
jgi:hypothetical protein